MAQRKVVQVEGTEELLAVFLEISRDFGIERADKFLVGAARAAMKPALATAKRLAPVDTGALRASLQVEARRPTSRDRRSRYVNQGDVALAFVTTAPGYKLKKKKFKNRRTGKKEVGIDSDARATVQEFGSATVAAKPFMRPALESNQANVVRNLAVSLEARLEKYRKTGK